MAGPALMPSEALKGTELLAVPLSPMASELTDEQTDSLISRIQAELYGTAMMRPSVVRTPPCQVKFVESDVDPTREMALVSAPQGMTIHNTY